jgi:hypothetical protein
MNRSKKSKGYACIGCRIRFAADSYRWKYQACRGRRVVFRDAQPPSHGGSGYPRAGRWMRVSGEERDQSSRPGGGLTTAGGKPW